MVILSEGKFQVCALGGIGSGCECRLLFDNSCPACGAKVCFSSFGNSNGASLVARGVTCSRASGRATVRLSANGRFTGELLPRLGRRLAGLCPKSCGKSREISVTCFATSAGLAVKCFAKLGFG